MRVAHLENEIESLRLPQSHPSSNTTMESIPGSPIHMTSHENYALLVSQFESQSQELLSLQNRLHESQTITSTSESKLINLEILIAETKSQLEESQNLLQKRSDYQVIKNELVMLKSIEFDEEEVKEGLVVDFSDSTGLNRSSVGAENEFGLERLLMSKNRRLQGELLSLKVRNELEWNFYSPFLLLPYFNQETY